MLCSTLNAWPGSMATNAYGMLGAGFLQHHYTLFDRGNARLGVGPRGDCAPAPPDMNACGVDDCRCRWLTQGCPDVHTDTHWNSPAGGGKVCLAWKNLPGDDASCADRGRDTSPHAQAQRACAGRSSESEGKIHRVDPKFAS